MPRLSASRYGSLILKLLKNVFKFYLRSKIMSEFKQQKKISNSLTVKNLAILVQICELKYSH
jgi:hypothetical protein